MTWQSGQATRSFSICVLWSFVIITLCNFSFALRAENWNKIIPKVTHTKKDKSHWPLQFNEIVLVRKPSTRKWKSKVSRSKGWSCGREKTIKIIKIIIQVRFPDVVWKRMLLFPAIHFLYMCVSHLNIYFLAWCSDQTEHTGKTAYTLIIHL